MMAYRSDRDEDNPPNVEGVEARKAEWDLISGNHQGQRSMTARTGRTQDCTRSARRTVTDPLQRGSHPHRTFAAIDAFSAEAMTSGSANGCLGGTAVTN